MPRLVNRRKSLASFWRDRRGVSAVEFALISPILVMLYFGMAELTQAMMAQRRLALIASSIGDLTAQNTQLTNARRDDIFTIGTIMMAPFPTTTLRMCLVSITSDSTGRDTVNWSESYNSHTSCPTQGTVLGASVIPAGVLPASQSVIMAKASYAYRPPVRYILPATLNFNRTFYLRARKSDTVARVTS